MPQVTKGGKFIFGWSLIGESGAIKLPSQAISEYDIASEGKVILFTGSKSTGGFCVTRHGLWLPSKLGFVLTPEIAQCECTPWAWVKIKGRSYCWAPISASGGLELPPDTLSFLHLQPGDKLLSIRSSDIAFTMRHFGQLVERANAFDGDIPVFEP